MQSNVTLTVKEYEDLLRCKEIVQSIECMIHEPEFKAEFIARVKEARERVRKGECVRIKSIEELDAALDKIE